MTNDEHKALRAQTVADMHATARPVGMRYAVSNADHQSLSQVEGEEDGRPYTVDRDGRRWLLDGSGDVA